MLSSETQKEMKNQKELRRQKDLTVDESQNRGTYFYSIVDLGRVI
jgi:hypothetical protein